MSAIWGKINFNKNDISNDNTNNIKKGYNEYKIDRYSEHYGENFMMGCGIQYITKFSSNEKLPYYDKDNKICFTTDCILDNRNSLIEELSLSSEMSDGLVVYNAFKKWGMECFVKLRGMFSIAIYDMNANKLIIANDKIASRCIYYYWDDNGECVFSTLINGIKQCYADDKGKIKINNQYICDFVSAPGIIPSIDDCSTPYFNIFKLEPATIVEFSMDGIKKTCYWEPKYKPSMYECNDYDSWNMKFTELFKKVINESIRTDAEVGISLSSGLDSASIGGIAASILKENNKKLYSYTYIPFYDIYSDNQRHYVNNEQNDVMKIVNMHNNIVPSFLNNNGKNCYDEIDKVLKILEIPFKSYVNSPNLKELYDKAYSDGCRIVLMGQYGNTTISYGKIEDILYDSFSRCDISSFWKILSHYCKKHKFSRKNALKMLLTQFTGQKIKMLLGKKEYPTGNFAKKSFYDELEEEKRFIKYNIPYDDFHRSRKMYADINYSKTTLTYLGEAETKMSLSSGIVLRDPSRSPEIIEFCLNYPYKYYAWNGLPRNLIRNNMKDYIPADILYNLFRHGNQNADWLHRIELEWDRIKEDIRVYIDKSYMKEYIDYNKIDEFLKNNYNSIDDDNLFVFIDLLSVVVLSKFIENA